MAKKKIQENPLIEGFCKGAAFLISLLKEINYREIYIPNNTVSEKKLEYDGETLKILQEKVLDKLSKVLNPETYKNVTSALSEGRVNEIESLM